MLERARALPYLLRARAKARTHSKSKSSYNKITMEKVIIEIFK